MASAPVESTLLAIRLENVFANSVQLHCEVDRRRAARTPQPSEGLGPKASTLHFSRSRLLLQRESSDGQRFALRNAGKTCPLTTSSNQNSHVSSGVDHFGFSILL
jgi:hypothetical protein